VKHGWYWGPGDNGTGGEDESLAEQLCHGMSPVMCCAVSENSSQPPDAVVFGVVERQEELRVKQME
jgi:hypothetical protein